MGYVGTLSQVRNRKRKRGALPTGGSFTIAAGIGVYGDNNQAVVDAFVTAVERPMAITVAFMPQNTWLNFSNSIDYLTGLWPNKDVIWSVPVCPADGTIAEANTGARDAIFTNCAQKILAVAPAGRKIIIRVGWEFNLNVQPWFAGGNEAGYVSAFRRIVGLFRAVSNRFVFEWCANMVTLGTCDVTACYPGDAFVDIISQDCYYSPGIDSTSNQGADTFGYFRDNPLCGLIAIRDMAAARGKLWGWPEWNLHDSVPGYNNAVLDWLYTNKPNHVCYWEGDHASTSMRLRNGDNPLSLAAFKLRFGRPVITTQNTVTTPINVQANIPLTTQYAQSITWSVISGTAAIVGSTLQVPGAAASTINIGVRATNEFGLTRDLTIAVTFQAAYTFTNAEASSFVGRMTTPPNETRKAQIDALYTALKSGPISGSNLLAKCDAFWLGGPDAQAATLNGKGTYGTITPINSPTYLADRGYAGLYDGTFPRWLDTNVAFSRSGNVFVQNSATLAAWQNNNIATATPILGNGNIGSQLWPKDGSGNARGNTTGFGTGPTAAMADARGFIAISRTSASAEQLYKNGVQIATTTTGDASGGVGGSEELIIMGSNVSFPDAHQPSFVWMGSALTVNEHKDLYNAVRNYQVAIGLSAAGSFPVAT